MGWKDILYINSFIRTNAFHERALEGKRRRDRLLSNFMDVEPIYSLLSVRAASQLQLEVLGRVAAISIPNRSAADVPRCAAVVQTTELCVHTHDLISCRSHPCYMTYSKC